MYLPRRKNICFLISKIFLVALLCLQIMWSATVVNAQHNKRPLEKIDISDLLEAQGFDKKELIEKVTRQGINFPLTIIDEQNIRLAGTYLKPQELDALIASIRDNYLLAPIKKLIVLRLGKPSQIEHLGFKATYIKKVGNDYLIKIKHPGADEEVELKTHHDCEHIFKWGHREFTLNITGASPAEVNVVLANNTKPSTPTEGGSTLAYLPPPEKVIRISDCLAIRMRLVTGNHIGGVNRPMNPYYISEPLTVGILRYYASKHTPMTAVPPDAKDTDPITEIYYEDALDIALMLRTRLPSLEQWVNAFHSKIVTLKPRPVSELVAADKDRSFLTVQMADSNSPANTPLSPQIATQKSKVTGPAKGFLRIVFITGPGAPLKIHVTPKEKEIP